MDKIEIQILDSSWTGTIDVNNDGRFPITLTSSIADISNINERSGSYSFPFEIETTKENEIYFEHLYYTTQKNYKNFDDKKDARIIINGIDIDDGTIRIQEVVSKENYRKYKFTFYGNNLDWVVQMKGKTFQDLPYLDTTYTYDKNTVTGSWSKVAGDYYPVFSYIKRGNRKSGTELSTSDFYPDYYMYDVIKEAFKSVGYTVSSSWLEQSEIKKLFTPFFGLNFKRTQADIDANSFSVDFQNTQQTLVENNLAAGTVYTLDLDSTYSSPPLTQSQQTWNLLTGNSAGQLNLSNGQYTAPYNGYYDIRLTGTFEIIYDSSWSRAPQDAINYRIDIDGLSYLMSQTAPLQSSNTVSGVTTEVYELDANLSSFYMNSGQIVKPTVLFYSSSFADAGMDFVFQHTELNYKLDLKEILVDGEVFNWKTVSDDKKSLLKYITDVAKIHNLYFRTNTSTKTVYIEPRDNFYNALTTAENWTDRIYENRQYSFKYNSSFYKRNHFYGYAEDDNDKYLEEKTKEFKEELMGVTHVYPSKFDEGTTEMRTEIISPTLTYEDEFGVVCATMIDDETGIADPTTNFNPRLLYYNYSTQLSVDLSTDTSFTLEGTTYSNIPYCLPFDHYQNNTKRVDVAGNLSFKDLDSVSGRYTQYYQKTAREIADGITLYISFKFDFVDYRNLDFRKPIFIDNRFPDIEGYWYIQKVKGFNNDVATDFELIKAKNYSNLTLVPNVDEGDLVAPDGIDASANRITSSISRSPSTVYGQNNKVEGGNVVIGYNLEATGTNTYRTGVHNVDVSTDVFQLGAGSEQNPFSLIRVDSQGNVVFNGQLIRGDLFNQTIVKERSTDTILSRQTKTYIIDTSSNDVAISLSGSYQIGDTWNIKKKYAANKITFNMGSGTYQIDWSTTSPQITNLYTNFVLQYIGDNKFIKL